MIKILITQFLLSFARHRLSGQFARSGSGKGEDHDDEGGALADMRAPSRGSSNLSITFGGQGTIDAAFLQFFENLEC